MKIGRMVNNLLKINEIVAVLGIVFLYLVLVSLTVAGRNAGSIFEGLSYPIYLNFILFPAYLGYVGRHDSCVVMIYCWIRYHDPRKAFWNRLKCLVVETVIFIIPYLFTIGLFAFLSHRPYSAGRLLLVGVHFYFSFLIAGVPFCTFNVCSRIPYCGFLPLFLLLSLDYSISTGYLQSFTDVSIYYRPMLKVLYLETTVEIILQAVFSLGKVIVLTILSFLVIHIRQRSVPKYA